VRRDHARPAHSEGWRADRMPLDGARVHLLKFKF
jgi:hypothetical protein